MRILILILILINTAQAQDTICIDVVRAARIADTLDIAKAQSAIIDTMQAQIDRYNLSILTYEQQLHEKDIQIFKQREDSLIFAQRTQAYRGLANTNFNAYNEEKKRGDKYQRRTKHWRTAFFITLGTGLVTSTVIYLTR